MLFIDNCALCLIKMCFTIAKPRPVPPIFLDLALSTRKNLSVSLSIYLSGIPSPLLITLTLISLFFSCSILTMTLVLSKPYLIAFSNRFTNT